MYILVIDVGSCIHETFTIKVETKTERSEEFYVFQCLLNQTSRTDRTPDWCSLYLYMTRAWMRPGRCSETSSLVLGVNWVLLKV